jgi:hypothetical protein
MFAGGSESTRKRHTCAKLTSPPVADTPPDTVKAATQAVAATSVKRIAATTSVEASAP